MLCLKLYQIKVLRLVYGLRVKSRSKIYLASTFFWHGARDERQWKEVKKYANPRFQELPPIKDGRLIFMNPLNKHEAMFFMKKNTWKQALKRNMQEVIIGLSIPKRKIHKEFTLNNTM